MLSFMTTNAAALLKAFDDGITENSVRTWERLNGGSYMHKADDWRNKAFMTPNVKTDRLEFNWTWVEANCQEWEDRSVYAYYHGHLMETYQRQFYYLFTAAIATAKPTSGDTELA